MTDSRPLKIVPILFLLFFLTCVCTAAAVAAAITPTDVAARLQKTYEDSISMKADFRQDTTMALTGKQRLGAGTLVFMKPGHMRWDYTSPDRQVLISDGRKISMYFAKSHQLIVTSARDYLKSDVSYAFFSGTGNILRDFKATFPEAKDLHVDKDEYLIELQPTKPQPQIARLYVWASRHTFLIMRLRIVDHFNTVTDLYFDNIRLNTLAGVDPKTISSLFSFTPPQGTEIIEQ